MLRSVADHVADPRHAGPLDGAALRGEARAPGRLVVALGLWLDRDGAVVRARFRASSCAALIAYAEAACVLLERGAPPALLRALDLRAAVTGAHAIHHDRAELVAVALARAVAPTAKSAGAPP